MPTVSETILEHVRRAPLREVERQTGVAASTLSQALKGKRGLSGAAIDSLAAYFKLELKTRRRANRS